MGNVVIVNSVANTAADTIEKFYDSPSTGGGTIVSAFTATNNTGINASYKAYIYDASESLLAAVMPLKVVVRNRFDLGSSVVNQLIPKGGSLRMEASALGSITFRVSGKEL